MSDLTIPSEVIANLIIGSNGATSINGNSRKLTFKADRDRFHYLRSLARAIVIGGETYRTEPYDNTELPLYVASRRMAGAEARFIDAPPVEVVKIALSEIGEPVLIEGGVNFLSELLPTSIITKIYLTRSKTNGDGSFFDERKMRDLYRIIEEAKVEGGVFESWILASRLKS